MIVQITMARDEIVLIKELLPVWSKFSDGFVFCLDSNTDETKEYLESVKDKYNILEIIENQQSENNLPVETDVRQRLFDTAMKYSNKIICLDADEYLDGTITKQQLENLLDSEKDVVYHLQWIQYTGKNTIRTDGPWKVNFKDRIGSYNSSAKFEWAQMHSSHLPLLKNQKAINSQYLFIAHLQWLSKIHVATKQYFWKTIDYVNNKKYGIRTVGNAAYDASVNNFEWEESQFNVSLKIDYSIFDKINIFENYKYKKIKELSSTYNVPNLGDWGYNITELEKTHEYKNGKMCSKINK
jgi:hypothetical protein